MLKLFEVLKKLLKSFLEIVSSLMTNFNKTNLISLNFRQHHKLLTVRASNRHK
jgi:hypothetical protein